MRIATLTTFHENELMAGALRAGARGGALIPPDILARVLARPDPAKNVALSQRARGARRGGERTQEHGGGWLLNVGGH